MNLYRLLQKRADEGKPVLAALIGAGKFGSMFLSQARRTRGLQVAAVADLSPQRARESLALGGLPIGLAHGVKLTRPVAAGKPVTWADVAAEHSEAVHFRHEMETLFTRETKSIES